VPLSLLPDCPQLFWRQGALYQLTEFEQLLDSIDGDFLFLFGFCHLSSIPIANNTFDVQSDYRQNICSHRKKRRNMQEKQRKSDFLRISWHGDTGRCENPNERSHGDGTYQPDTE
jgi:hypothetical protein